MTNDLQIWEQIDRYLSGVMTAKEQELFKEAIASDEQLADMVKASQIANEVVIGHEVLKLKDQMSKDLNKPKGTGLKLGISLLLLTSMVAGGVYLMNSLQQPQEKAAPTVKSSNKVHAPNKTITSQINESTEKQIQKPATIAEPQRQDTPAKASAGRIAQKNEILQDKPVEAQAEKHVPAREKDIVKDQKSEITIPKVHPKVEHTDPCSGTLMLTLQTSPSCTHENTGSIHVNHQTITGGKAPYKFSVHADGDFVSGDITGLAPGNYTLYIKDGNACAFTHKYMASIQEIACRDPKKEFTYHLGHDPAWKIPYHADKTAKSITITNRAGQEVYHSAVYNGSPEEWNGESNTGLQVSLGYHVYTIVYVDNTSEQGSIIIVK